ncbi:hypothetical protein ACR6C2_07490 [Streptomyces sp. INA 01156]
MFLGRCCLAGSRRPSWRLATTAGPSGRSRPVRDGPRGVGGRSRPEPGDDERTVWAALEEVTAWCVVVRVWRSRPRRGAGVAEQAGPGVRVHVVATAVGSEHG